MAVVHEALNEPVSSGVWNHEASEIDISYTSTSVGNSPETVQTEEFVVRSDVLNFLMCKNTHNLVS